MRKLRPKDGKKLAQGHTVCHWHSWESDLGLASALLNICFASSIYHPPTKAVVWLNAYNLASYSSYKYNK